MASKSIIRATISSAKATLSRTVQSTPDYNVAFPLSTMAIAYASALPATKPATNQDSILPETQHKHDPYWQAGKHLGEEQRNSKRLFHSSSISIRTTITTKPPVIIQRSSDRTIDPYLGNLLDGFCNGSCHN